MKKDGIEHIGTIYPDFAAAEAYYLVDKVIADTDVELKDKEQAEEYMIFNGFAPTPPCGHEHDCCGCWFSRSPEIVGEDDYHWIARVSSYQNV